MAQEEPGKTDIVQERPFLDGEPLSWPVHVPAGEGKKQERDQREAEPTGGTAGAGRGGVKEHADASFELRVIEGVPQSGHPTEALRLPTQPFRIRGAFVAVRVGGGFDGVTVSKELVDEL